jgi:hypothetical protein
MDTSLMARAVWATPFTSRATMRRGWITLRWALSSRSNMASSRNSFIRKPTVPLFMP